MPQLLHSQRSPEWFAARKGKITASLAGAILGLDKNKSQQEAYREILGIAKDSGNKHTRWGEEFEPVARDQYEIETGRLVLPSGFWTHPRLPWLGASPDGLVGADGLLEVKCPGKVPDDFPPHHVAQMVVQMACTGRAWCDYYAFAETTFLRRMLRDERLEIQMLGELEDWYTKYILTKTPPPARKRGAA